MRFTPLLAICALGTVTGLVGCSSDATSPDTSSDPGAGGDDVGQVAATGVGGGTLAGGGAGTGGASAGGAVVSGSAGTSSGAGGAPKLDGGGNAGAPGTGGGAGGALGPPGTNTFCKGAVVYDGETGSHPLTTAPGFQVTGWPQVTKGSDATGNAAVGTHFLKVVSDPGGTCCGTLYSSWTGWDKAPASQPIDVSKAASVQFWIRIETGMYWNLMVEVADSTGKNSFTGADVHVADYIAGKNIDATWRQATVPLSALNTNGINLAKLSGIVFEGDRPVTFDIDQIVFCDAQ
jgi:hypothetical protein